MDASPDVSFKFSDDSPVQIDRDPEFISQGWPGTGVENDPFVIENLNISTTGGHCIDIRNTGSHFLVRNCSLTGADSIHAGIYLESVVNGSCVNNSIRECHEAIELLWTDSCSLQSNNISDCVIGLSVRWSPRSIIMGNDFIGCGITIDGFSELHWRHNISENLLNGFPVEYFTDTNDITLQDASRGQLILVNCSNIVIQDCLFSGATAAIQSAFCGNITISNVTIENCWYRGIFFYDSLNCSISCCGIVDSIHGIKTDDSAYFSVSNCTVKDASHGFDLLTSNFVTLSGNTVYDSGVGAFLVDSSNISILDNRLVENYIGLLVILSSEVQVLNNSIMQSHQDGISVHSSSSCSFKYNEIGWSSDQNAEEEDCTCTWDDEVSRGNGWSDYNGTGSYHVFGNGNGTDHYPYSLVRENPILGPHPDIMFFENETGNCIEWTPVDENPWKHWLYLDGSLWIDSLWNGSSIVLNVDGLAIGSHDVYLGVENIYGGISTDFVRVIVMSSTPPQVESISDVVYRFGEVGNQLVWNVSTATGWSYILWRDGLLIGSGFGFSASGFINISVDGLYWGLYNYTVEVLDEAAQKTSDTAWVTVLGPLKPIIDGPDDIIITSPNGTAFIDWFIEDDNPLYYEIIRNGSALEFGSVESHMVYIGISGYAPGTYNFTLIVSDTHHNLSTDTVMLVVRYDIPVGVEVPSFPLGELYPPVLEIGIAIVGLIASAILISIKRFRWENIRARFPRLSGVLDQNKAFAVMMVLLVLMSALPFGIWILWKPAPSVRIAVLDSGIDAIPELHGRIAAQKSFILSEYGYAHDDTTVTDSMPHDFPHGTTVARLIAAESPHAAIVNAKIGSSTEGSKALAVEAAIRWAVEEQNCSIINYSYGSSPLINDRVLKAAEWAFKHGALVITPAGNKGDDLIGSSLSSPGTSVYCMTVGAIDPQGTPAHYSSIGPASDHILKPDICAFGHYSTSGTTYYGTSFSSPRVAAAAVEIVHYCHESGLSHTPGMLKAALMASASPLPHPSHKVGAGALNPQGAINLVHSSSREDNIPDITYVHPSGLPIDVYRLFLGDTYRFAACVISSIKRNFSVVSVGPNSDIVRMRPWIQVDQVSLLEVVIELPVDVVDSSFSCTLQFESEDIRRGEVEIQLEATKPVARVALDTSLSNHTMYGRYWSLLSLLTSNNISVTEISSKADLLHTNLTEFDSVLVLSPYSLTLDVANPMIPMEAFEPYNREHAFRIEEYFENGGNVLVACNLILPYPFYDNAYEWCAYSQQLWLEWVPVSLGSYVLMRERDPLNVTQFESLIVSEFVDSLQHVGPRLIIGSDMIPIAWNTYDLSNQSTIDYVIMAAMENETTGGRFIISASDFFLSNKGLEVSPMAEGHLRLVLDFIGWLTSADLST
jgi:parallel beta-helix repeat protein